MWQMLTLLSVTTSRHFSSHEDETNRYLLLVHWRTMEDHAVGLKTSPEYQRWKALLDCFYDPFSTVEHSERRFTV